MKQIRSWDNKENLVCFSSKGRLIFFRYASISGSDDRDSLTDSFTDSQIGNWQSLRLLRSHRSKWNVTQNAMSLKMEFHSTWNVTQNRMSLKIKCHSNGMSLRIECLSKWNITQNGMPHKMQFHSKGNIPKSL